MLAVGCGQRAQRPPPSPSASPQAAGRLDILSTGTKLYSLRNEELIVRDFFQDRRGGVFLDVGCAWPVRESNTCYLERHLGWSGIVVDALAEYGPAWRKRPRSRFFNYLVTDHWGTREPFYRADLTDMSSFRSGNPKAPHVKWREVRVPTITLSRLLDENGVSRIDFLSMDIEDAEPLALAGFDIERFRPELACVEARTRTRASLLTYFAAHGYQRIERYRQYDQVNYYFTPRPGGQ
jgi:FkbM family methyltransferase